MSEKKKTVKKADAAPHTQASPEKLEAAKAELAKMIEGVQNGEKLLELIDIGYKKGKLSSGEMMEVLESITLETEQLDKVYDVLENLGVDTAGDDFVPELDDDVLPSTDELEELPEDGGQVDGFLRSKLQGRTPDEKEKRRLTNALLRRGFPWGEVKAAWRRLGEEMQEESS